MKAFSFVFILSAITANLFSQENIFPIDSITGEIIYSGIVEVDSINSQELYVRTHAWFTHSFGSAQNVIQLDDKETGKIIGKGNAFVTNGESEMKMMGGFVDFYIGNSNPKRKI